MYSKSLAADCCLGWKYFYIKLNNLTPLHTVCGPVSGACGSQTVSFVFPNVLAKVCKVMEAFRCFLHHVVQMCL